MHLFSNSKSSERSRFPRLSRSPRSPRFPRFPCDLSALHISLVSLLLISSSLPASDAQRPLPACPQICNTRSIPARFKVNTNFYKQFLIGPSGIPIIASDNVSQEGMFRTFFQTEATMAQGLNTVVARVRTSNLRVSIYAQNERITDLPENTLGSNGASGLFLSMAPGTLNVAVALVGERSSLFNDGGTTFHELGHAMQLVGMNFITPGFGNEVKVAYNTSISNNLWKGFYAATDDYEYWAEGSRIWFGCSTARFPGEPANKAALEKYDPALYALLTQVYVNTAENEWTYSCLGSNQPICDRNAALATSFVCPTNDTIQTQPFTAINVQPTPAADPTRNGSGGGGTTTVLLPFDPSYYWIIGGVLVLVIAIIVFGCLLGKRRRKRLHHPVNQSVVITPYGGYSNLYSTNTAIPMANIANRDAELGIITDPFIDPQPPTQALDDLIRVIELNGAITNHLITAHGATGVSLSDGDLLTELTYSDSSYGPKSVKSQFPLTILKPGEVDMFYYEVKIVNKVPSTQINIGICDQMSAIFTNSPGWTLGSYAYSSDGFVYRGYSPVAIDAPRPPVPYNVPFKEGDVVGVGHVSTVGTTFFTLNGISLGEVAGVEDAPNRKDLFACVGADGPCTFKVNFGLEDFEYPGANFRRGT